MQAAAAPAAACRDWSGSRPGETGTRLRGRLRLLVGAVGVGGQAEDAEQVGGGNDVPAAQPQDSAGELVSPGQFVGQAAAAAEQLGRGRDVEGGSEAVQV